MRGPLTAESIVEITGIKAIPSDCITKIRSAGFHLFVVGSVRGANGYNKKLYSNSDSMNIAESIPKPSPADIEARFSFRDIDQRSSMRSIQESAFNLASALCRTLPGGSDLERGLNLTEEVVRVARRGLGK